MSWSKSVIYEGIQFDSPQEVERYQELSLLQLSGAISGLTLQKEFELVPRFKRADKTISRRRVYTCDFYYFDAQKMVYVIEDVKGRKSRDYPLRRAMVEYLFCRDGSHVFNEIVVTRKRGKRK